jgi:hypothetical protein
VKGAERQCYTCYTCYSEFLVIYGWIDEVVWEVQCGSYWGKERDDEHWFSLSLIKSEEALHTYPLPQEDQSHGWWQVFKRSFGKSQEHLSSS